MTYSIVIDDEPYPLATTSGWKEFKVWANQSEGALKSFIKLGYSTSPVDLENDLRSMIQGFPINNEGVQEIAHDLLRNIMEKSTNDKTIFITDSTGPTTETNDEDFDV